ncbi:sulfurtransferase [Aetokthonos hydrillicola Thurmond2011]|jgi:thiosulfate/3-mercaptopyruvate sulfurtransferase|uniref:Sulfurtransferase n=1 Tax=Aetokthonos hydrillicola Thurmond2011 TaxID=2712845 RepID=A0AAP5IGE3_9CYAN|nr:sulfurtransferase [Aetokthonos hydrillicola]MBO3461856.1 sulfurtransferase [Aetokthonos hydrillicola CCALA 1050]MBW4588888.1 sulfurtransferase [Aetokthonos hydrillicola CCALA 1050]MDR9900914.1 sulfurtransferase [Aetokthonos hydrillicola Thurmond2011]
MLEYTHPEVLVDTEWLMNHLNNPTVRVIEVDMSPEPYKNSHIPGAVFWNILTDLLLPDLRLNLEATAIEKLLSRSGISNETTVIAYGSYPGIGAWIFWILKMIGHEKVYVLNGGYSKWAAEGRPLAAELSSFPPSLYRAKSPDPNLRVPQVEVQASLDRPDCVLLDARTPEEYRGEVFMIKPPEGRERAGHIPGAVHVDHSLTLNEDGTFKSASQLHSLYSSQGITPDKEIFPYCAIGGRSGYTWFVLRYLLGYPKVRNYDGSWNEWSRLPDVPIEQ